MLKGEWNIFWKRGIRTKKVNGEKETWNFNQTKRPTLPESESVLGAHRNKYECNLNIKDKNANVIFYFASSGAGKTPLVFWFVLAFRSLCICTFVNLLRLNYFFYNFNFLNKIKNSFHYTLFQSTF